MAPILLACSVGACGERGVAVTAALADGSADAAVVGPPPSPAMGSTRSAPSAVPHGPAAASTSSAPPEETPAAQLEQPASVASVVLAAGGDVNFGRECGQAILRDASYDPFRGLNAAWTSADARFVNLESQLSDQGGVTQSPRHRLIFTGPPGGADVLALAHISLVSTANNHAWDYGKSALLETIENLERAQVAFAGTGRDAEQAYRPVVVQIKGLRIALFAVTHVWNQPPFATHEGREFVAWADSDRLRGSIERARREHDFVLVSYHGGEEYAGSPVEKTRRFAEAVMALGVDAFIGHHPHVPQGIGWVDGRPILYSLGNLVFAGHEDKPWTQQSFFARLTLRKGQPALVQACPYALDGHRPRSLDPKRHRYAVQRFREHLKGRSAFVGGVNVDEPDADGCFAVTAKSRTPKSPPSKSPPPESPNGAR
jgi:poly-gamma-glutamate capsule biosynthesis protein CapA/YwtB (metallophosphatase superfamily)